MQLVDDKEEHVVVVRLQPISGAVEDAFLDPSHQHDVQHAVVCYKNIGGGQLHIPPPPHLSAVDIGEIVLQLAVHIRIRRDLLEYSPTLGGQSSKSPAHSLYGLVAIGMA
jgi:hypothetical protein